MIAAVHDVVSGLALDSLGRLRRRFQHRRVGSVVDVLASGAGANSLSGICGFWMTFVLSVHTFWRGGGD